MLFIYIMVSFIIFKKSSYRFLKGIFGTCATSESNIPPANAMDEMESSVQTGDSNGLDNVVAVAHASPSEATETSQQSGKF